MTPSDATNLCVVKAEPAATLSASILISQKKSVARTAEIVLERRAEAATYVMSRP